MKIKPKARTSIRLALRLFLACSTISIVLVLGLIVFYQLANTEKTYAAVSGDYRSKTSGNWNATTTWETFNGTQWIDAVATPTNSINIISIQSGHIVTITANVTADQVEINTGGEIILNSGRTLTIANGTGTDITVSGLLTNAGTITLNASANIVFVSGSTYKHNLNAGVIPIATWQTGSTCSITGVTGNIPSNLAQTFYNLTWNCPGQTASALDLDGLLTSINGDLTIISTGSGEIMLGKTAIFIVSIGGNYYHQGGTVFTTRTSCTINVSGNYIQTGGILYGTDAASSGAGNYIFNMNVTGNFSISGGTFNLNQYNGSTSGKGIGTLNLTGNFTQTGGTVTETATTTSLCGYGIINYVKSGTQIFLFSAGTMNNTIHFNVNNGSILEMGTSFPTGNGSFSVLSGGALNMASPAGITSTSLSGNVQVTGTRSFSTSGNYTYNGIVQQVTGDGLPAIVNNLTIDNSNHVTLTNTVSTSGILTLNNGQVITGSNELIVTNSAASSINGYTSTNYVRGNLRRYVNASGSYDFPLGTSTNYEYLNLNLTGISGFSNILGSFTNSSPIEVSKPLTGIYVSGTVIDTMLDYGFWTVTPNLAMTSGTYNITLRLKGHSNKSENPGNYCILKRNDISTYWESNGTHSNTSQTESSEGATAVRSGLTSFSQFGIGKSKSFWALPIKLLYFDAKKNSDDVTFSWATAVEINNDFFSIERSIDGIHFETILTKPGAGNSTITLYYSDIDENPVNGTVYYRLKQTDFDGHFSYSVIRTINFDSKIGQELALKLLTVAPNPFEERFIVSYTSKNSSNVKFQLIDFSGKVVFENMIDTNTGMNQLQFIDEKDLKSGIYFMVLYYKNEKIVQKIVKK